VFDDALAQYEKAVEIDPGFAVAHWQKGNLYAHAYGRLDKAISSYQRSNYVDPGNPSIPARLGRVYLDLGDERQAQYWIDRSQDLMPNAYRPNYGLAMLELYRGQEARALEYASKAMASYPRGSIMLAFLRNHDLKKGHYAKALARYEKSFPKLLNESEPGVSERNYKAAVDLALVVLKTGKQERAKKLLDRSFAVINTLPRLGLFGYGVLDAKIYALRGEKEKALAALREAIDGGWRRRWWYFLEHDPTLESLRDEPEFQAMVEEIEADMAEQLARVRDWEANGELLPTPESLEQSL
jgi:tetratricopeptide (TPR) repeat protein